MITSRDLVIAIEADLGNLGRIINSLNDLLELERREEVVDFFDNLNKYELSEILGHLVSAEEKLRNIRAETRGL